MASTFSLFFPLAGKEAEEASSHDDRSTVTTSPSSPSSSSSAASVDCTLSLGTPSSRRAEPNPNHGPPPHQPTLSWDAAAESYYQQPNKPAAAHDHLLMDRRCANCGTSSTPLWRNGPRGPKSLCNACGIRFKKEERRAAESGAACVHAAHRAHASAARAPHGGAVSYGEEARPCSGGDADDAPFLAWRFNVAPPVTPAPAFAVWPERATLIQYN